MKKKIISDILANYKTINAVSIGEQGFHTITIEVSERQPFGLWCKAAPSTSTSSCYFFDQTGFVFAAAPPFQASTSLQSLRPAFSGCFRKSDRRELSRNVFGSRRYFSTFIQALVANSVTPVSFSMPTAEEYEIDTSSSTKIYIDPQHSFADDISNLTTILANSTLHLTSVDSLQYLDLRLDDKVFYKLKNAPSM